MLPLFTFCDARQHACAAFTDFSGFRQRVFDRQCTEVRGAAQKMMLTRYVCRHFRPRLTPFALFLRTSVFCRCYTPMPPLMILRLRQHAAADAAISSAAPQHERASPICAARYRLMLLQQRHAHERRCGCAMRERDKEQAPAGENQKDEQRRVADAPRYARMREPAPPLPLRMARDISTLNPFFTGHAASDVHMRARYATS